MNKRFQEFRDILMTELGDKARLNLDNSITIQRNEFSPERHYYTLQHAIDAFSRYLPIDFVNKA